MSARSSSSYYTVSDRKKSRTPVRPFPLDGATRTDKLIAASIQWAEKIMERIDAVFGK